MEKLKMQEALIGSIHGVCLQNINDEDIYNVPYTAVLDLVKTRQVLLQKGRAFISESDLLQVAISIFKSNLEYSLQVITMSLLPMFKSDSNKALTWHYVVAHIAKIG